MEKKPRYYTYFSIEFGKKFLFLIILISRNFQRELIFCINNIHTILKKSPKWAVSTAWSISASARTMVGLLPPSSRVTLLILSAADLWIILPTSVEPVNATLSTFGCSAIAAPAVGPNPKGNYSKNWNNLRK